MKRTTLIKWGAIAAIVIFLIWFNQQYLNIEPQKIRDWILSFGLFSPFIYIILYTFRPIILFPASVLSLAGGLAFGPVYGTIYTIIGATLAATVAFFLARKLGKNLANKRWKGKGETIQQQLSKNGFVYVLLLRLIPLFNFDMISYLAGVSKVKYIHFAVGTMIGIIPGTFAYNFLGASIVGATTGKLVIAIILFIVVALAPLILSKKLREKLVLSKEKRD
jgi:uncharacterized membrane protein YdjX (TVP38/TMEM64 family)